MTARKSLNACFSIDMLEPRRLMSTAVDSDFNSDGNQDLLFRNYSTGANAIWYMNGAAVTLSKSISPATNTNQQIGGTGDFDGNGTPDIVWHRSDTGQNAIWFMGGSDGSTVQSISTAIPANTDTNWQMAGVNDFNNDNKPDILWRNVNDGRVAIWFMNGLSPISSSIVGTASDSAWVIKGSGDFNSDGITDIVFRKTTGGFNSVWALNSSHVATASLTIQSATNTAWQLSNVLDMNGDNKPDLVWRNASNGANSVWLMNGTIVTSVVGLPTAPNTAFQIAGGQVL